MKSKESSLDMPVSISCPSGKERWLCKSVKFTFERNDSPTSLSVGAEKRIARYLIVVGLSLPEISCTKALGTEVDGATFLTLDLRTVSIPQCVATTTWTGDHTVNAGR